MIKPETKYWNLKEIDTETVDALASDLNETQLLTSVIFNRGIRTPYQARRFLQPSLDDLTDSMLLNHMPEAVERCLRAYENGESILIFGDNDVDGVTSTTLLYQFFEYIGANVRYFLPRRKEDGHGFNDDTLRAAFQAGKPNLLITVDCGMSGRKAVEMRQSRSIARNLYQNWQTRARTPRYARPRLPRDDCRRRAAIGRKPHVRIGWARRHTQAQAKRYRGSLERRRRR